MARLLASRSLPENAAEHVSQQKLAVQSINRELCDADEANLLDEEDMYVFGLLPMTDPLHLVCCNACKKPVKASQYAAHAELCRSLNCAEEMTSEPNGCIGRRKPPRKERKKLLSYTNRRTPVGEKGRSEYADINDIAAAESQLDEQPGIPSSFPMDEKRNSASIDVASTMDGKGLSCDSKDLSACVVTPPTKRSKLKSSHRQHLSNDPDVALGLAKTPNLLDPFTLKDFQVQSTSESDMPNGSAPRHTQKTHDSCLLTNDIPVPLASKIYYSQRNNHFRSAVTHLYHVTSTKESFSNMMPQEQSRETTMKIQACQSECSYEQHKGSSAHKSEKNIGQSTESCLEQLRGSPPITNFSSQNPVDDILRPQTAAAELLRSSKYKKKAHPFASNSGQSLGTVQQPNGSVHVL